MATFHILNGDALLDLIPETILAGQIIVARECLVDGPVSGKTLEEFWQTRSGFIASEYGEEDDLYYQDVVSEFNKVSLIPGGSEVNLWFEEDLFCQVNLWFCISLLSRVADQIKINLVKPPLLDNNPDWRGFGSLDRDALAKAYQERQRLSIDDISLLRSLWKAYKNDDRIELVRLASTSNSHFPFLQEVVQAHLDRFSPDNISGRPETVLKQIMKDKNTHDFKTIFREWGLREGIYGFGDWQVENILKKLPEFEVG